MEHLLEKAKKAAQQAELFIVKTEETPIHFEANRLKHIQTKQSTSIALRIIKDGRIGYAVSSRQDAGDELINMALETAKFGQEVHFDLPDTTKYQNVDIYDEAVKEIPLDKMVSLGEEIISKMRELNSEIECEASIDKATASVEILNSKGFHSSYKKSIFGFGASGLLVRGSDMLFVSDSDSSCRPITTIENVYVQIKRQLENAKVNAQVKSKNMPVLFTPYGVVSALAPSLGSAFNGKVVLEGSSPIGDKLGKVIFDEKLKLYDNPLTPFRPASRPFDDEGMPSQTTVLIEEGKAKNFLYDLRTASLAGTKSTGNGERSHAGAPTPSPSSLIIESGDSTFDEVITNMKEGIIVEYLMGAEQGNILGGDFSGNVLLGYKVENGIVTGRVKDTMVSGNVFNMLKSISAICDDGRWVGGVIKTPSILFENVAVASK